MLFYALSKKVSRLLIVSQLLSLCISSIALADDNQTTVNQESTPSGGASVTAATYESSPFQATITSSTYSLPADGVSQTLITVQLLDQNGIPLSHDPGGLQLFASLGTLGEVSFQQAGSYHATLTAPELSQNIRLDLEPESDSLIPLSAGTVYLPQTNGAPIKLSLELNYEAYGKYTAVLTSPTTPGTAIITAALDQTPFPQQAAVTFSSLTDPVHIEGVSFGQNAYAVTVGQTVQTALTAQYSSGAAAQITSDASYTLQDSMIATVTPGGLVKGISTGTTVLTAVYQNVTSTTEIRVSANTSTNPGPSSGSGTGNGGGAPQQPSAPGHVIQMTDNANKGKSIEISPEQLKQGIIKVTSAERTAEIKLSADQHQQLLAENSNLQVKFQTAGAALDIPLSEIKLDEFSRLLGIPKNELIVDFKIAEASASLQKEIQQKAAQLNANLISAPVEFQIRLYHGDDQVGSVTSFDPYISRTLHLLTPDLPKHATGIAIDPKTGEFRFVPTRFDVVDGKPAAILLTKGVIGEYAVIDRQMSFADVTGHWGQDIIESMASKLILQGKDEHSFEPDAPISRGELAALLVRALGLPDADSSAPFADTQGKWYETAINSAYRSGLINGYEDGTFQADKEVSRDELVTMVLRALEYTKFPPQGTEDTVKGSFQDQGSFPAWAKTMILKASDLGLVQGDEAGRFNPDGKASRAEAAAILYRMLRSIQFI